MMEALFAKASQGRTFLLMVQCGALLALGAQAAGAVYRAKKGLGLLCDGALVLALSALLGWILLISGEGLRLYGLLGLCIGAALYAWGIGPLAAWLGRCIRQHTAGRIPLRKNPLP